MSDSVSIFISLGALAVSIGTAWATLFRRGSLKMTRPSVVYFGADGPLKWGDKVPRKIHLRALMYSTGKRGCVIESMFVRLKRGESQQTFNVWVYGEDKLARGSGLYVGETGVVCNHHFLPPADGTEFQFLAGDYRLEVFTTIVGMVSPQRLSTVTLHVSEGVAQQLLIRENGAYFDWGPDSQAYSVHVREARHVKDIPEVLVPRG